MEPLWSLYNQLEKLRIDALKTEHVRIILLAIPTRRMGQWYACREGDMTWLPISEIAEFYEDVRAMKGLAPAGEAASDKELAAAVQRADVPSDERRKTSVKTERPPAAFHERRPLFEEAPAEEAETVDLKTSTGIVAAPVKERRAARRYPRELEFKVRGKEESFVCETQDISLNGIALKRPLPKWVPKTFKAKLSSGDVSVRILCGKVSDSSLRIMEVESWEILRKWIVKW
ncbi:MAG: PilZ domain-containing protein [Bdellovibrionales bacterium]|nr:PilZ domain-containing protein [Bdellovibrionales bacterium]